MSNSAEPTRAAPTFHTLRLTYFDGPGRAEPVRLAFLWGGVAFEDERLSVDEWTALSAAAAQGNRDVPLLQLPVLTVDTIVYGQSMAQLRFAGRLTGLYPTDPVSQLAVDEIVETTQDVLNRAPQASDPERKRQLRVEYASTLMRRAFQHINDRLAARGSASSSVYAAGSTLSIADLCVVSLCALIEHGNFEFVPRDYCDDFPAVKRLVERLRALPGLEQHLQRPPPPPTVSHTPDSTRPAPQISVTDAAGESALPPEPVRTWSDDPFLGKTCPPLHDLDYVKGTAPPTGQPMVVVLWAAYSDADYGLLVDLSRLVAGFPSVGCVGVSCDPRRSDVDAFCQRLGGSFPELKIPDLQVEFALAFDPGRAFRMALNNVVGQPKANVSTTLLVDAHGVIVWKEQFNLTHTLEKGQFGTQLQRLVVGEALVSNGPSPVSGQEEQGGDDLYGDDPIPSDIDSDDSDGLLL
eukprot:m.192047 g.192047  ORF g.192047 m.192047 type:complete len:465 (+) comp18550_c0_seq1:58-1452(+)